MTTRKFNGEAARAIREASGMSLRHLAEITGHSAGYLSRIERGEYQPSASVIQALAKQLGCKVTAITSAPDLEVPA